jgi:phosphinothricin acetyltransferase
MIRNASPDDLPMILGIYNEVIAHTTSVYSEEPVSLANRLEWLRGREAAGYPVLVACDASGVTGFASFGDFRAWPCYCHTVEHSLHVRADRRGQGIGRTLLVELIARAAAARKHVMIAGVDADNQASIALHQSLGFEQAGLLKQVGRKFGRWLDLVFLQKILAADGAQALA